ncbi:hypothetical protein [Candidatus Kuenenia stuttgartiensis]|uniref:hypothetical protein n=1 Tax=Kuenenia stuttgartiensis TaxID=174633 RepID=UPI00146AB8DB|nr:hypothetical protein [Candidatus Kuenenia stuttgartiensis]
MLHEGRIIDRDWSNYIRTMSFFMPKLMRPEKLLDGFHHALKESFSYTAIFKRLWGKRDIQEFLLPHELWFQADR